MIPHKSTELRESGLLDDFAPEILRCAQDDTMKKAVILSAAKDLLRAYGESPVRRADWLTSESEHTGWSPG